MNIVDGRLIADRISKEVQVMVGGLNRTPKITVITCAPNFATEKFLALKKAKADALGIDMETVVLPKESTTDTLLDLIEKVSSQTDGLVVQLPLPSHIDTSSVLASIPKALDVDVFSYQGEDTDVFPPVVGAIDEISKYYQVTWQDKNVVIFGAGKLVGAPMVFYAQAKKAKSVEVVNEHSDDSRVATLVKTADIIILGVGKPKLLTADMIKEGVVIFDAGASEDGGLLVGDASLEVASKATLLTPVPGGIGPVTVALLFRNLLKLSIRQ